MTTPTHWLIHESHVDELVAVLDLALEKPDAAEGDDDQLENSRGMTITNGTALIPVRGVLTNNTNRFFRFFGVENTGLDDLMANVKQASADPHVSSIVLDVDSPGGSAGNPLMDAAEAIHAATKPTTARVGEMAASAAYWLASQADEVVLAGRASAVGAIGVVVNLSDPKTSFRVPVTSTKAPRKRPDPTTAKGKADIRAFIDPLHDLFVEAVARGRGVTAVTVNRKFGQGGLVVAEQAVAAGMADRIEGTSAVAAPRATIAAMDLETLRREHPELYAAVKLEGATAERDRVLAHLTLQDASGDTEGALADIKSGAQPTMAITARHSAAMMASNQQGQRSDDDPGEINAGAPSTANGDEAAFWAERAKERKALQNCEW